MEKHKWNSAAMEKADKALLDKVNAEPGKLKELPGIEYGDDGIARYVHQPTGNEYTFDANEKTPETTKPEEENTASGPVEPPLSTKAADEASTTKTPPAADDQKTTPVDQPPLKPNAEKTKKPGAKAPAKKATAKTSASKADKKAGTKKPGK